MEHWFSLVTGEGVGRAGMGNRLPPGSNINPAAIMEPVRVEDVAGKRRRLLEVTACIRLAVASSFPVKGPKAPPARGKVE